MKRATKYFLLGSGILSMTLAISCIVINKSSYFSKVKGQDVDYTLTINAGDLTTEADMEDAHGSTWLVTDSTKEAAPVNQNKVKFDYNYAPYADGYNYLTQNAGWIQNDFESPIRSIKEIQIFGSYAPVLIEWGWSNGVDGIAWRSSDTSYSHASGYSFYFNYEKPNYFKVSATNSATVPISKIVITYDKTCEESVDPYIEQDNLRYKFYGDDGLILMGFVESPTTEVDLVIPKTVAGRTVQVIEDGVFGDEKISSVYIPNTVELLGDEAFYSCDELASVTFEPGETPLVFSHRVFGGVTSLTGEFVIPKRAANDLTQYAMDDMKYVSSFRFEDNYSEGEYRCADGVLYGNYGKRLHTYPMQKTDTTFTIPSNVTSTNSYVSFSNNSYIEEIIIQNTNALYIDSYSISNCDSLTSVQFNGTGRVTLNWYVFSSCDSLNTLVLPEDVILDDAAIGRIANSGHEVNVFCKGGISCVNDWDLEDDGYGPWYRDKSEYCKVYLYSEDAAIDPALLPDNIEGSWHYVSSVPTVW